MLHYAVLPLDAMLAAAATSILKLKSPLAGMLTRVDVLVDSTNAGGAAVFDVHVNGVTVFTNQAHRPQVASGASAGNATTIDAPAIARGDTITIDADTIPTGGVGAQLVVTLTIEDSLPLSATAPTQGQMLAWSLLAAALVPRDPALTHDDVINDLYYGALARVPTTIELAAARTSLVTGLNSGRSGLLTAIRNLGHTLFTSGDYTSRSRTDAEYAGDLYLAYLGRIGTGGEIASWVTALGSDTRANIDTSFSNAAELSDMRVLRIAGAGLRAANPMTTSGDLIYGGASGVETRLPKGTNGQVARLVAGLPAWSDETRAANPMTTAGDMIIGGAAGAETRLAKSTDGKVLALVSGAPAWATPSGAVHPFDATHPDAVPASPNAADDEFNVGSSLDTAGTRRGGATAWAWVNQDVATGAYANSHLLLSALVATATANSRMMAVQAISGAFKFRCKLEMSVNASSTLEAGMVVRESSSGKVCTWKRVAGSSLNVHTATSATASNTSVTSLTFYSYGPLYLEIEEDGSNRYYRYSTSGIDGTFVTVYSEAKTTFITTNQIGLYINGTWSAPCQVVAAVDWFRRIS